MVIGSDDEGYAEVLTLRRAGNGKAALRGSDGDRCLAGAQAHTEAGLMRPA